MGMYLEFVYIMLQVYNLCRFFSITVAYMSSLTV